MSTDPVVAEDARPPSRGPSPLVVLGLVAGVAFVTFVNTLANPFFFDDADSVVENESIRSPSTAFSPHPDSPTAGRPIVNLSFALNYAVGGLNPFGYHVVSLLLHVLATLVLADVVWLTLSVGPFGEAVRRRASLLGLLVALVWCVHPLNAEVVNYATQRTSLMFALCLLVALDASVRSFDGGLRWSVLSVVACAAGMACKEVMVVAPLVIVLHDFAFRDEPASRVVRRRWPHYTGLAATWLVLVALGVGSNRQQAVGTGLGISVFDYLQTQCWAIGHYLWSTVVPWTLFVDYGDAPHTELSETLPGLVAILVLLGVTVWGWFRRRPVGYVGTWFFLLLAPTSSVLPIATEVGADRRMYLPLAGLVAAGVLGLHRLLAGGRESPRPFVVAVSILVAVLSVRTIARNTVYHSVVTAWENGAASLPSNYRAHANLAQALVDAGRTEEAEEPARAAFELKGTDQTCVNYAQILRDLGKPKAAADVLRAGSEQLPNSAVVQALYAATCLRLGLEDERRTAAARALALDPEYADRAAATARARARQEGRADEAIAAVEMALALGDESAANWFLYGNLLRAEGDPRAASAYRQVVRRDPENVAAWNNLAVLVARSNPAEAVPFYERALALDAANVDVHVNLASALANTGRFDEAIGHLTEALRLQPGNRLAARNLGIVRSMQREARDAP